MVTIDVLLAAYNGEKWLDEQLRSLQRQAFGDFRVLMQDDGSTDGTPALLEAWEQQDARFTRAAEQGRHAGAAGNFFSLMRQSNAPYCALCDQDDVWAPDRLLCCLDALQAAEERYGKTTPLLVHSDCCLTDEQGAVTHTSFFLHQGWRSDALTLPPLLVQNNATGCTMLMNAALRDAVTAHLPTQAVCLHDWYIALTAAALGHVLMIDLPLVHYRQHSSNVMGASRRTPVGRALHALRNTRAVRERIALTYRNAAVLRQSLDGTLPPESAAIIDRYLATQHMGKMRRVIAVQRGGYRMQSLPTRLAQMLFG